MKAFKRILCVALCLTITILGLSFMAPKADALALTVGLGIVVAALAAGGLTYLVTSGGVSALTEAVSNNVEDWLEDTGNVVDFPTPGDFFEFLGDPDNQDPPGFNDGRVIIGAASGHLLINFLVWLKSHLGLVEDDVPVSVLNSYALPLQNGYLHLSEISSGSLVKTGDIFNTGDYTGQGEVVLFYFYNGNYMTFSPSGSNFKIYGYYPDGESFHQAPFGSTSISASSNPYFTFGLISNGSQLQLIYYRNSQQNWTSSSMTTSNTSALLYGIQASNNDVSAELVSDPSIDPDDFQYGDLFELEFIGDDPIADLDDFADAVIAGAVAGTLEVDGDFQAGEEQLQYPDSILGWLQWIWEALANTRLSNIIQEIRNLPGQFANWFQQIITWLGNLPGTLTNLFNDLKTAIQALPQQIANAVSSAFALDPELALEISDAWNGKFGWVSDIKDWFEDVTAIEPEPPVIYIHLENANSHYGYSYGGREIALDLSWYAQYKQDVDTIISGFLWLGFLWLVFKRTADIIQGVGMADREAHDIIEVHDVDTGESHLFRRRRK